MYVANFPFSIQFLRGHFGAGPKLAPYTLLLSEPALMCDLTLYDAMMDNQDRVKEVIGCSISVNFIVTVAACGL